MASIISSLLYVISKTIQDVISTELLLSVIRQFFPSKNTFRENQSHPDYNGRSETKLC